MRGNLQDVLHLIICLAIIPAGVVEAACENCETCNGNTCTECSAGYFIDNKACYQCYTGCRRCTGVNMNQCTACKDGYYRGGSTCKKCSSSCVKCSSISICAECESGTFRYLNNGHYYCAQCPAGCSQCYAVNEDYHNIVCTDCSSGYFKQSNGCTKCPTSCTACISSTSCSTCETGRWGTQCLTSCGTHCTGNECTSSTGACTQGCDGGYYGDYCTDTCLDACITCTSLTDCQSCIEGNYLDAGTCSSCSPHCYRNTVCNKVSGSCTEGCDNGWHGNRCDRECTPGCSVCNQDDGACTECNPGKHGVLCDHDCSLGCQSINGLVTCAQIGGTCTYGCVIGHWKNTCENLCNDGCLNSTCDTSTGHCVHGCLREYFGESCDFRCSENCLDVEVVTDTNLCRREGGACLGGCKAGYYGDTCGEASESACKQQASVIGPALGGGIGLFVTIVVVAICVLLYRKGYRINKPGTASQTYTGTTHENDVEIAENHDADSSSSTRGHHEYESPMEYEMTQRREDIDASYDVVQLPGSSASVDSQESSRMEGYMDMRPGSSVGSSGNGSGYVAPEPKPNLNQKLRPSVYMEMRPGSSVGSSGNGSGYITPAHKPPLDGGYIVMSPGRRTTAQITIRPPNKEGGYIDIVPASQPQTLPTVMESE